MGPPTSPPKCISNQLSGSIRFSTADLCGLVEPVVRNAERVPVVFIRAAVKLICSALGHHADLAAGGSARIGVRAGRRHAELLNGIER